MPPNFSDLNQALNLNKFQEVMSHFQRRQLPCDNIGIIKSWEVLFCAWHKIHFPGGSTVEESTEDVTLEGEQLELDVDDPSSEGESV